MKYTRQSIGKEKAIELYNQEWWKGKTYRDIAEFQILTDELCCPFVIFHEALEKTLDRPVYTHELGLNRNGIMEELFENKPSPSFADIFGLLKNIPPNKKIIIIK